MELEFYKSIIEKSTMGYANHRIILDDAGNPVDYEYLEANAIFLKIFGLEGQDIIGKRATEIFPGIGELDFDWITKYGDIAIHGGEISFDKYAVGYDSWFRVNAYSPAEGYFISWLVDISKEKKDLEEKLVLMNTISDIIFVIDENYTIKNLIVSEIEKLFVPKDMIIGSTIYKLLPDGMSEVFIGAFIKAAATGEKEYIRYPSPVSGDDKWYEASVSFTEFVDEKKNYIVSINEITAQKQLEARLDQKTEEMERFFNINLDLLCIADMEGNFIKVNKAWEDILGYTAENLEKRKFLEFVHPDDMEATLAAIAKLSNQEKVINFVNRYCTPDGAYRYIEWRSQPYGDLIYAAARDITDRKLTEEALRISQERLYIAMKGTHAGLWDWNMKNNIVYYSIQWATMLGYEPDEIDSSFDSWRSLWHPEDKDKIENAIADYMSGKTRIFEIDHRLKCKNGDWRWVMTRGEIYRDEAGVPERWTGTNIDISRLKEAEEKIQYLSIHDQLTGLYNRRFYEEEMLKIDNPGNLPLSLIMGDLNGLKAANDNYGHLIGDKLIQKAAEVMKKECRDQDIICRIGGDEFVMILPKTKGADAGILVKRIENSMKNVIVDSLPVSVAFGWATKLLPDESMEDVFKKAEEVMYLNKILKKDQ